jgi:RNA-directed DNA polymerase
MPTFTPDPLARSKFTALKSRKDLAKLLEVPLSHLSFVLYKIPHEILYTTVSIAKRHGGSRTLSVPHPALKKLQVRLSRILLDVYGQRSPVHGFVRSRNVRTGATPHAKKRFVLNVDLADFFTSIHFGRVLGLIQSSAYLLPKDVAIFIAQLCSTRDGLPQGAPTSPIISNMICSCMDRDLMRLAAKYRCHYTRYADDLSFSTNRREFPPALARLATVDGVHSTHLGAELSQIIQLNGFQVNPDKVRLQVVWQHQQVTGLTVNALPNVKRTYVRQVRAMVHAIRKHSYDAAEAEYNSKYRKKHPGKRPTSLSAVITGRMEYLRAIRGPSSLTYLRLANYVRSVLPGYRAEEAVLRLPKSGESWDVFIIHASEDKVEVVDPLVASMKSLGIDVWVDNKIVGWGDSFTQLINNGLANSRFVLVVLSRKSYMKTWPLRELNAALAREIAEEKTRILPLLVGTPEDETEIRRALPLVGDKHYLNLNIGCEEVTRQLKAKLEDAGKPVQRIDP